MAQDSSGAAFPVPMSPWPRTIAVGGDGARSESGAGGGFVMVRSLDGLTKRELFAAMAISGLLGHSERGRWDAGDVAERCVEYADALLAELAK